MPKSKIHHLNLLLYFLLSITFFIGYFLGEDSSGSGGFIGDFYGTWPVLQLIKNGEYFNFLEYTIHFPLHYYILFFLNLVVDSQDTVRFIFTLISLTVPYIFFLILQERYSSIEINKLFFFSQVLFLMPSLRSGAIWANTQLSALIFFMISILFFLKWDNRKLNKIDKHVVLQCFFLSLAVYSRQLYAIIFIFILYLYFLKLSFKEFIKVSLIIFIFALPGFFIAFSLPKTLTLSFYLNLANSLIVNTSIISFYLIPIFFIIGLSKFKELKTTEINKTYYIVFLSSLLLVIFSHLYFNYNPSLGGGFFIKLSMIIFSNLYFFFFTAIIGIVLIMLIFKEDKKSIILFILLVFGFSSHQIFQKYYEPMMLILLFSIINFNQIKIILNNYKNIFLFHSYFLIYLILAIINDIFKITKTFV